MPGVGKAHDVGGQRFFELTLTPSRQLFFRISNQFSIKLSHDQ
jgi:hypothetical protein